MIDRKSSKCRARFLKRCALLSCRLWAFVFALGLCAGCRTAPVAVSNPAGAILGRWKTKSGLSELAFKPDGTCETFMGFGGSAKMGLAGTYTASGVHVSIVLSRNTFSSPNVALQQQFDSNTQEQPNPVHGSVAFLSQGEISVTWFVPGHRSSEVEFERE